MNDFDATETTMIDISPIVDPISDDSPEPARIVPGIYERPLGWKAWTESASLYLVSAVLAFGSLVALLMTDIAQGVTEFGLAAFALTVLFVTLLLSYREYWRWLHSPYYVDPEQGVLFQYQAKNKWLYLLGSDPRTIDLDTADYLPAPQTIWENYVPLKTFRHSCTITIDGPGQQDAEYFSNIKHFMYGEQISAIILYRKGLAQRHQEQDMDLQERQAIAAETMVRLLTEINAKLDQLIGEPFENEPPFSPRDTPDKPEDTANDENV